MTMFIQSFRKDCKSMNIVDYPTFHMYPSPLQIACKHNYLCGIPNYIITEWAMIYVIHAGPHTCRVTICLEGKCGLSGAFKEQSNRYPMLYCLGKECLVPKIKANSINRAIKTYLTRSPVHMGPWSSLAWFLAPKMYLSYILKLQIHNSAFLTFKMSYVDYLLLFPLKRSHPILERKRSCWNFSRCSPPYKALSLN